MRVPSRFQNGIFRTIAVMVLAAPVVGLLAYFRVYLPAIAVDNVKFPHLLGISGASIIAIVVRHILF